MFSQYSPLKAIFKALHDNWTKVNLGNIAMLTGFYLIIPLFPITRSEFIKTLLIPVGIVRLMFLRFCECYQEI